MLVTIFQNIKSIQAAHHRDVSFILDRIKNGNSKKLCEAIRAESDKKVRNELKKELPSILFSGVFNDRKSGSMPTEHSGLIVIDIDNIPLDKIESEKAIVCQSEYVYSCFISPSGNGFKVLIKIPADIKRHGEYFKGIELYFLNALDIEIDTSGKNINRVCYESYDPDIYINEDSLLFTDLIENIKPEINTDVPTIPVTDISEIQRRVVAWWTKNYTYVDGQKHHSIIALAGAFNRFGVSYNDALRYCNSLTSNPESQKCNEKRVKWFYEKYASLHGSEHFENVDRKKDIVRSLDPTNLSKSAEILKEYEEFQSYQPFELEEMSHKLINEEKNKNKSDRVFWYYDDGKLKIDLDGFFKYIEGQGYSIYYPVKEPDNYKLINQKEGIIRFVDTREIKNNVLDFVKKHEQNSVYNVLNDRTKYWGEKFLNVLPVFDEKILRDERNKSFIPTPGGLYVVTKDEVKKVDYVDLTGGYIFDTQITKQNFEYGDHEKGDFEKFIRNLAGSEDKFQSLRSIIGYLMHNYKDPAKVHAVFLYDKNISQIDGEPEGGSGKSLLAEGLKRIREVAPILGDRVDFSKSFVFQEISESTQIAWVDEMPKDANYQPFFGRLSNNLPIEKKNKNVLTLSYEKAPKFLFTQNFKPKGASGSHKRRKIEFGVSNYYSFDHSPRDDFHKNFFTEWNEKDWNQFFTFMVDCLKDFLANGVRKVEDDQNEYLEIATELGKTIADFFILDGKLISVLNAKSVNVRNLYDEFIREYGTDMLIKEFIFCLRKILNIKRLKYEESGKGEKRMLKILI